MESRQLVEYGWRNNHITEEFRQQPGAADCDHCRNRRGVADDQHGYGRADSATTSFSRSAMS